MHAIDLFDGHCDALLQRYLNGDALRENNRHVDLLRAGKYRRYAQFFAIFASEEELRGETLQDAYRAQYRIFCREMEENRDLISFCRTGTEAEAAFREGKSAAFLSVEGAELLDCSLERLEEVYRSGVRAVNLTWNHANALSGSIAEEPERGLSALGRKFVCKMASLGMLVDVSHLSDHGFWDVAALLKGPFIASHSNSRDTFFAPRNLTDAQFTAIIEHNGVAGMNLYANFLGDGANIDTVIAHLEHFLSLGGERNVALGADFDGCALLPDGIAGIQDIDRLFERLLQRNYDQTLIRGLFFENLMRVVKEVCIT